MTKAQFIKKMRARGFKPDALGYWVCPDPLSGLHIYPANAGESYSAQLAYMIKEYRKHCAQNNLEPIW